MAPGYWIKLYHEVLHDPKMGRLSDRHWRRAVELMLMAGETDETGVLPPVADMAWTLRTSEEELLADLQVLAAPDLEIVTLTEEGWVVTHFAERQGPVSGAERVRRHRERKRREEYYGSPPEAEPQPGSNAPVTKRYTDTDTDRDTDTERDGSAPGGAPAPATFQDWQGRLRDANSRERVDLIEEFFREHLPNNVMPEPGYIAKTAKALGGFGRLIDLLWQQVPRPPTGDVLAYVRAIHEGRANGRASPRASPRTYDHPVADNPTGERLEV